MSTEHIIVMVNTEEVRATLHQSYDGTGLELVNSSPSSMIWRWYNAPSEALAAIASVPGYKGMVQVS